MTAPSTRPTLLLVPGLLNDARVWDAVRPALAPLADIQVAAVDRHDSIGAMAAAAAAGLPTRFAVAGFSMGGYVALELARRFPTRVAGLALIGSAGRAEHPDAAPRRRALLAQARQDMPRAVDDILPFALHPARLGDTRLTGALRAMMGSIGIDAYARQVEAVIHRGDQRDTARGFSAPACVIHGRDDRVVPLALGEEMARLLPRAQATWIPDCGHMAPLEQPEAVTAALADWLAGLAPETGRGRP